MATPQQCIQPAACGRQPSREQIRAYNDKETHHPLKKANWRDEHEAKSSPCEKGKERHEFEPLCERVANRLARGIHCAA
jgi:hypothetical protein